MFAIFFVSRHLYPFPDAFQPLTNSNYYGTLSSKENNMEPVNKLKLVIIQSTSGIYISDNVLGDNYFTSKLQGYKIDGLDAEKTYVKDWFKVSSIPIKIERNLPEKRINVRYELKEGYPESELTPKVINVSYIDEDDQYYRVVSLYDVKYDLEPSRYEDVEFEIIVLDADANFKTSRNTICN